MLTLILKQALMTALFIKYFSTLNQVEKELIDKLDMLVSENKGDNEYKELFNTM